MKRLSIISLIFSLIALVFSVSVSINQRENSKNVVTFIEPELTIYQIASMETGCPEWVLVGLRYAESSFGKNIDHPDEYDTGDYGLHEHPSYRAERVEMCGDYNPYCPLDSAIVAGHIIMEHYKAMGDIDKAISAYRRGRAGTNRNGIDWKYVNRVKEGGQIDN